MANNSRTTPKFRVLLLAQALLLVAAKPSAGDPKLIRPSDAIGQLRNTEPKQVGQAVDALLRIDPAQSRSNLSELIAGLKSQDSFIRYWSCVALERFGPTAKEAADALIAASKDSEPAVRVHAAVAIGRIAPETHVVSKFVTQVLDESAWSTHRNTTLGRDPRGFESSAAELLLKVAQEDELIANLLSSARERGPVRAFKLQLLGNLAAADRLGDKCDEIVDQLIAALRDSPGDSSCVEALAAFGVRAVPKLVDSWAVEKNVTIRGWLRAPVTRIGAPAVPALIEALRAPDPITRASAAEVLQNIGRDATPAIPALITAFDDRDSKVREHAAFSFWEMQSLAKDAVPGLVKLLRDPNSMVAFYAIHSLHRIGPDARAAVPALLETLHSPATHLRREAAAALAAIGGEPTVLAPALVQGLQDSQPEVRLACLAALWEIGNPDRDASMPTLTKLLDDKDASVRRLAVMLLLRISPDDAQARDNAARLLKEKELSKIDLGPAHAGEPNGLPRVLLGIVVPVLDDPFDPSWADAISTLRSLGPGAVAVAAKLVELIGEYEKQRELAFGALVTMGPQVLPTVQPLVDSEDANLRIIAGRVLCRNGQRERGMQMLLAELSHPREQVRHLAIGGLSEVIADFPDQTPPIVAMLRSAKEPRGRAAAASALYFADPHADRPAVQALIAALADPDAGVRRSAAFVLGAMSDSPPPCAGPLRQSRFAAFSEFVKYRESRQRPWPDMPTAIVALSPLLQDPEAGPRDAAVHALGMAGRESIPVLPLLKMLENDESQEVRFQLSNAWRRIEPWNLALDRPERPVFRPPRRAR